MKITDALDLREREVISFVGGGGKTTLMFRLAEEIPLRYKVLITTTTKISLPPPGKYPLVLLEKGQAAEKELAGHLASGLRPVVGSGLLSNNKLEGITGERLALLRPRADFILAEADGSKGLSLKGHLDYEPVISRATTLLVAVVGADIIGKTLDSKYVHRPEVVSARTGREMGSEIDASLIAGLITHPEEMLRDTPPDARVVLFINKADRLADTAEGYRLAGLLLGEKIEKVILGSAMGESPIVDILKVCGGSRALEE